MSRIGKQPVTVPAGVDVKIDGHIVTVKGPKGELTREFNPMMTISQEGEEIIVSRPDDSRGSQPDRDRRLRHQQGAGRPGGR